MNRATLLIALAAVVAVYVIDSNIQNLRDVVESKQNEAWIKHSDLPDACLSCHNNYYNRIDTKMAKFKDWHELKNFVSCQGKYKQRIEKGGKIMPCLNVEPLAIKMAYKMMVK